MSCPSLSLSLSLSLFKDVDHLNYFTPTQKVNLSHLSSLIFLQSPTHKNLHTHIILEIKQRERKMAEVEGRPSTTVSCGNRGGATPI
ncbi:hypothetical protein HanIR_Chr10g0462781 [Helianthus annuus]|nr:hypothetical protein HanIR_Chr10g0462781 [Helianthus annuus]